MAADGMFFKIRANEKIRVRPGDLIKLTSNSEEVKVEELEDGRITIAANVLLTKGLSGKVIKCSRSSPGWPRRIFVDFPGLGEQKILEGEVDFEVLK